VTALLSPRGTAAHLSGGGDWRWQHRLLIVALVLVAYALVAACLWLKIRDRVPRWTVHLNIAVVVVLVSVAAAIGPGVHAETDPRMTRPNPARSGPASTPRRPAHDASQSGRQRGASPDFLASGLCTNLGAGWTCDNPCVTSALTWPKYTNGVLCTGYVLEAINVGRAAEGLAPLVLPTNWYRLTQGEQLFVVADLERTARDCPLLGDQSRAERQCPARGTGQRRPFDRIRIRHRQGRPGCSRNGRSLVGGIHGAGRGLRLDVRRRMGRKCRRHLQHRLHLGQGPRLLGPSRRAARVRPGVQPRRRPHVPQVRDGHRVRRGERFRIVRDLIELPKGVPPAMTFYVGEECRTLPEA